MRYAIIAAGEGSRLAAEGVAEPKPLVRVGGEVLIDRLIRVFMDNDAEEIFVICNEQMTQVAEHLAKIQKDGLNGQQVPLKYIVKSTPSSMHSFFELSGFLNKGPFVLTTVDTIFREDDLRKYMEAYRFAFEDGFDGVMGVTDYIDDEKPLYVEVNENMNITAFLDKSDSCKYISGGIYGLNAPAIQTLNACIERGESRMRNFQRALVADGMLLKAYPFSKVLDIDHAEDIKKAEEFVLK